MNNDILNTTKQDRRHPTPNQLNSTIAYSSPPHLQPHSTHSSRRLIPPRKPALPPLIEFQQRVVRPVLYIVRRMRHRPCFQRVIDWPALSTHLVVRAEVDTVGFHLHNPVVADYYGLRCGGDPGGFGEQVADLLPVWGRVGHG